MKNLNYRQKVILKVIRETIGLSTPQLMRIRKIKTFLKACGTESQGDDPRLELGGTLLEIEGRDTLAVSFTNAYSELEELEEKYPTHSAHPTAAHTFWLGKREKEDKE